MPLISNLDKHKFGYRGEARTLDGGRPDPLGRAQARARHSGDQAGEHGDPQQDGYTGAAGGGGQVD